MQFIVFKWSPWLHFTSQIFSILFFCHFFPFYKSIEIRFLAFFFYSQLKWNMNVDICQKYRWWKNETAQWTYEKATRFLLCNFTFNPKIRLYYMNWHAIPFPFTRFRNLYTNGEAEDERCSQAIQLWIVSISLPRKILSFTSI